MKRLLPRMSILALILSLTAGCAGMDAYLQQPTVAFKGVAIENPGLLAGTLAFRFEVINPTPIPLSVTGIRYSLSLNDKPFLKDRIGDTLAVPASGSGIVAVPISVEYLKLFQTAADLFASDTIAYALSGGIEIGPLVVPFSKSGTVPVPKQPSLQLASLRVVDLSLTGAKIRMAIGIDNPNGFPLAMAGVNYAIAIGGIDFADGRISAVPAIAANGHSEIPVDLQLSFLALGRSTQRLLSGSAAEYRIRGDMQIPLPGGKQKALPFTHQGRVPVIQ